MKKLLKIISPSYKRAGKIKTIDVFGNDLILAIHEIEKDDYVKAYPGNYLMIIPNGLIGNMAKVRNFIKQNCNCEYLVMVDDDINSIGFYEKTKQQNIHGPKLLKFILNGFIMCEELNTVLWGINLQSDPKFYREYSPISFLQPVLGPFSCHVVNNELWYDERLGLNEDYDYSLQVLHKYHKILRFNKYHYKADHLTQPGGCGGWRTMNQETEQSKIMRKKWGDRIVRYDFKKSTNPVVSVPLKGI